MAGFFNLQTPSDLLQKLQSDFDKLDDNPRDEDAVFNFFVTAESLLDWLHPGRNNDNTRKKERDNNILLQITSHLATGIKHFQPEDKRHKSVKDTKSVGGTFSARTFAANTFKANSFPKGNLFIELQGKAEQALGSSITAIELARKVLEYWQQRIDEIKD